MPDYLQTVPPIGEIVVFDPLATKSVIAKADAVADYAAKMHDWPLLEEAISKKLDEQADFVQWWRANVTPNRGARTDINAVLGLGRAAAEQATGITQQQVSKWATWLKQRDKTFAELVAAAMRRQFAEGGAGVLESLNTGDMEGYTPALYIEAARRTMGSIDVDPASHERAQVAIQATTYYTAKTDGLAQEWRGNVFLNPPYNSGLIEKFIGKLFDELAEARTTAAILLTNNNTDTRWFHESANMATAICLTKGRIAFYKPDSSTVAPTNGQAFFYFGPKLQRFKEMFSPIGLILVKAI